MNKYSCIGTVLVLIIIMVFFLTVGRIYNNKKIISENFNQSVDDIEHFSNELSDSQIKTLANLAENYDKERQKWSNEFYDQKLKQEDDNKKQSQVLNQIIKERYDLKALVDKSRNSISDQSDKFSEGIKKLGEFHNNYQTELESIIKRKSNLSNEAYKMRQKIQDSRLQKIQQEYESIAKMRQKLVDREDNEILSIKNLGTGDRININPILNYKNPTGKYLLFLNDGCVRYDKNNVYDTTSCEASPQGRQQFVIESIENHNQYNDIINKTNDGTKSLVFENDDIVYPFKVVSPAEIRGQCVGINENSEFYIEPCKNSVNQRFRSSKIPSGKSCN